MKKGKTKFDLAEQIREDIRNFKKKNKLDRLVMVWCGSTEIFMTAEAVHKNIASFEKAMKENHPAIAPSMLYAYAAISEGVPYANGAPNLSADIPALIEYAKAKNVPIVGKDFKTGQTLMKTILSPGFKARMLGLSGWFSTNILGNRDGEVLEDPGSFKTKEESKLGALEYILQPKLYPELYGKFYHKVRINYYPPRGDNKEGWDNIDIFGWLGYPDADQSRFPVPRFDSGRADRARPRVIFGSREARRAARHSGMAQLLFQIADVRAGTLPRARHLHSAHETEEHPALDDGRGPHHAPRRRILRLDARPRVNGNQL